MERDFDALTTDLQANLTSVGCINKDVRTLPDLWLASDTPSQCQDARTTCYSWAGWAWVREMLAPALRFPVVGARRGSL